MNVSLASGVPRRVRALRLSVLALVAALGVAAAQAATYKWVDDKGVVHYTDKMPPDAINRGNVELSKDGVQLRKVDPALTPEQRRAKEQDEERRRTLVKQQEETARRDRALLASYTSEGEIDLARQRALSTIETVLQSVAAYTEQIKKRQAEVKDKMATFKNRPVPPVLEREYDSLTEELERQSQVAIKKRQEAATVTAKYDADKARWRELSARAAETAAAAQTTGAVPAAVRR